MLNNSDAFLEVDKNEYMPRKHTSKVKIVSVFSDGPSLRLSVYRYSVTHPPLANKSESVG